MTKQKNRKMLAVLLVFAMVMTMLPVGAAFAAEAGLVEVSSADGYRKAIDMKAGTATEIIRLTKDITLEAGEDEVMVYRDLTIDLNGHTLTLDQEKQLELVIKSSHTVKVCITDLSKQRSGRLLQKQNESAIELDCEQAGANLVIEGITVEGTANTMGDDAEEAIEVDGLMAHQATLAIRNTRFKNFGEALDDDFSAVKISDTTISVADGDYRGYVSDEDDWTIAQILADKQELVLVDRDNQKVIRPDVRTPLDQVYATGKHGSQRSVELVIRKATAATTTNATTTTNSATTATTPTDTPSGTAATGQVLVLSPAYDDDNAMYYRWYSENRTVVPIRIITEQLGGKVAWNEKLQTVTLKTDDAMYVMIIGQVIPGFDVAAIIDENGRTLVPVRYVAEKLGAKVDWNAAAKQVVITR